MQKNPLLQAVHLHKQFGRREVLKNVDVAVHAGEIVTLIGPNGSGKTTLLRILLGLLPPDSGEVIRQPDLRMGYVPQSIQFEPTMPLSVFDFLKLICPEKYKITKIAEELAIFPYLYRHISVLSGGELQRVLLAQALLGDPQLLVLDEPVQGVDFSNQALIYQLIRDVAQTRGCAVLMVSHDLHLVMAGTGRVICLNRHVCCSGTPENVRRDPAFVSLFGEEIANQVAYYVHHHDHKHDAHGEVVMEGCDHDH